MTIGQQERIFEVQQTKQTTHRKGKTLKAIITIQQTNGNTGTMQADNLANATRLIELVKKMKRQQDWNEEQTGVRDYKVHWQGTGHTSAGLAGLVK